MMGTFLQFSWKFNYLSCRQRIEKIRLELAKLFLEFDTTLSLKHIVDVVHKNVPPYFRLYSEVSCLFL